MVSTRSFIFSVKSPLGSNPGIIISIVYFLLLLTWLGKNRLLGLDESAYADVVLGEARDHHWLPMFFEGKYSWDKPPLLLWLQGLAVLFCGPTEWALRFWSAVAGAVSVYFTYRLGAALGRDKNAGIVCALVLALQEHFILYSRIATMDMGLVCCLLGVWWQVTKALDPALENQSSRQLLGAGLWWGAAILIKSWFGLVILPAVLLVFFFRNSRHLSWAVIWTRLFLPVFLSLAAWILLYLWVYGKPFWVWEWNTNVLSKVQINGFGSPGSLNYRCGFYAVLVRLGLAFLWPFLPLGLGLWIKEIWLGSRKREFEPAAVIGCTFFFYYLLFLLVFMITLINYILPLVPVAVLSLSFLFRHPEEGRVRLAAVLACLLCAFNGWANDQYAAMILTASFILGALPFLPVSWRLGRRWFYAALGLLLLANGIKTQHYLRHPPDPNHAWVAAVLAHPARYRGETLLFLGDPTNARALEFYSDYQVKPIFQMPSERPSEAILFQSQNEAVFYPASSGQQRQ
jgi:4-amino-4-deoxy-L-arabinose transferase-like glycosyltransferase